MWQLGSWAPEQRTTLEFLPAVWIFGPNNDFVGKTMTTEPLFQLEGHLTRNFTKGFWASLDAAWYSGGKATIDGVAGEKLNNVGLFFTAGYELNENAQLTVGYGSTLGDNDPSDLRLNQFRVTLTYFWHPLMEGMKRLGATSHGHLTGAFAVAMDERHVESERAAPRCWPGWRRRRRRRRRLRRSSGLRSTPWLHGCGHARRLSLFVAGLGSNLDTHYREGNLDPPGRTTLGHRRGAQATGVIDEDRARIMQLCAAARRATIGGKSARLSHGGARTTELHGAFARPAPDALRSRAAFLLSQPSAHRICGGSARASREFSTRSAATGSDAGEGAHAGAPRSCPT
ncbi:MAG: hypothetical protein MZV65_53185 [Chromatiales bacterium]|nr:hypothetical protein [Chromatiales bacterium]